MTASQGAPEGNPPERRALDWRTVSAEGDTIQIRVAPVSDTSQRLVARALELGKAATNTTPPPKVQGGG